MLSIIHTIYFSDICYLDSSHSQSITTQRGSAQRQVVGRASAVRKYREVAGDGHYLGSGAT